MQYIRTQYGVPAKRDAEIRFHGTDNHGRILSARGGYVTAKFADGRKQTVHPLSLDYKVGGEWLLGGELLAKLNARIDAFNAELNKPVEIRIEDVPHGLTDPARFVVDHEELVKEYRGYLADLKSDDALHVAFTIPEWLADQLIETRRQVEDLRLKLAAAQSDTF